MCHMKHKARIGRTFCQHDCFFVKEPFRIALLLVHPSYDELYCRKRTKNPPTPSMMLHMLPTHMGNVSPIIAEHIHVIQANTRSHVPHVLRSVRSFISATYLYQRLFRPQRSVCAQAVQEHRESERLRNHPELRREW